jgi:hypothetical protein
LHWASPECAAHRDAWAALIRKVDHDSLSLGPLAVIDATGVIHTRPIGQNYDAHETLTEEIARLDGFPLTRALSESDRQRLDLVCARA